MAKVDCLPELATSTECTRGRHLASYGWREKGNGKSVLRIRVFVLQFVGFKNV